LVFVICVAANDLLKQLYTRQLEIISTEELELIEPIIAEGTTFPELLEKKWASSYHFYNMKWYLYSIGGQGKLPVNEYIGQLYSKVPHSKLWGITGKGATLPQVTDGAAFLPPAS